MPAPVPFPVEEPYRMRADLRRLAGSPFLADDDAPRYRAEKLKILSRDAERTRVVDPAAPQAALAEAAAAAASAVARYRPDAVRPSSGSDPSAVTVSGFAFPLLSAREREFLAHAPAATRLADALALSLQEDLVWMRDDGRGGRAVLLHVCFPSRWDPGARAGASLMDLHGPVADGDRLRAASAPLMAAIATKGPFERHVWSLELGPELDRHPDREGRPAPRAPDARGDVLAAHWFRVERQTTLPFPERALALFAIRVLVAPLLDVLAADPERARRLARSLRSMSPQVLRYKGLEGRRDELVVALDAHADGRRGAARRVGRPPSA